jgi:hypothetical protein
MSSFCARRSQKRKKDSQAVNLFTLLGSECAKAVRKYVGEIDPRDPESAKKTAKLSVFFSLLGSVPTKAAHRGGVVKVDIYEVDTKIELYVDMFLLGL